MCLGSILNTFRNVVVEMTMNANAQIEHRGREKIIHFTKQVHFTKLGTQVVSPIASKQIQ